jgi:hypothetical protein
MDAMNTVKVVLPSSSGTDVIVLIFDATFVMARLSGEWAAPDSSKIEIPNRIEP